MTIWAFIFLFSLYFKKISSIKATTDEINCAILREALANFSSSFTSCAILYSQPIKFCENCVNIYIELLESYGNLSLYHDDDGPCINNYVHLDRLEIIETLYRNSLDLWNRAKCYECFSNINGKLTNNFSTETTTYNKLYKNLTDCINRTKTNESICITCLNQYNELNLYYISISNENEKIGVCMDIVDLMNGTRSNWSKTCCKFRHKNETIFIVSTVIVCVITVVFYILTMLCSKEKIPIILKQTRFAGSFSQVPQS